MKSNWNFKLDEINEEMLDLHENEINEVFDLPA